MQEDDCWGGGAGGEKARERGRQGVGQGCAELRANQLWVPNYNMVTSTLQPLWARLCVPSWAPAHLLKENHQRGLLTKPTPTVCLISGGASVALVSWPLHGIPVPISTPTLVPPAGSCSGSGNPRWMRGLQAEDKPFWAFPSNPGLLAVPQLTPFHPFAWRQQF